MVNQKMNPEYKKLWVEALRSRDYKQGEGNLCTLGSPDVFCCLGVLCEIGVAKGVVLRLNVHQGSVLYAHKDAPYATHGGILPERFSSEVGIPEEDSVQSIQDELVVMNDDKQFDFIAIAQWIEDNL